MGSGFSRTALSTVNTVTVAAMPSDNVLTATNEKDRSRRRSLAANRTSCSSCSRIIFTPRVVRVTCPVGRIAGIDRWLVLAGIGAGGQVERELQLAWSAHEITAILARGRSGRVCGI